jgi:apolipoprotein N-acyltransferase
MCNLPTMRHWTISRQSVLLLLAVLTVIVLVLVLPQVDLLDTAFHGGTAPIALHARAIAKPPFQSLPSLFVFFLSVAGIAIHRSERLVSSSGTHKIQLLNHCFRC